MQDPILHEVISVSASQDETIFILNVDITDIYGERYTCDYVSTEGDTFGLAPVIRQALEQWIADGKTVAAYVAPTPVVPDRVTANQFGQQMIVAGIKSQVDAWVALQSDAVQWAYARSATFVREDPMMQTGFTALGFTSAQIDQFFIDASKIGAD